ncbi:MAG: glutamine synthetase family protein [Alicyclobacillus sp.]|nr:glutamine synthetase family protein [Alicyclobacillus sp.]
MQDQTSHEPAGRGRLGREELEGKIRAGEIDTVVLAICDMQGRLMGKRLSGSFFLDHAAAHGVHFCVYLLGTDMEMNTPQGFPGMGWSQGYGDWVARPDWSTARALPWLEHTAIVLADAVDEQGHLVEVAPRTVLRRQLERAAAMGFTVRMASELEFYLLREPYEAAHAKGYEGLALAGYYNEDYNLLQGARNEPLYRKFRLNLEQAGVPVECTNGEAGIAQHEINVYYAEALEAADRHVLVKQGLKEMALQEGYAVTFMAKPDHTWTGSSSHLHLSLWRQDGRSAFFDPAHPRGMSAAMQHFLAGVLAYFRDLAVLFAPNVNSYKRYAKASWAPTNVVWGWDNRTTGLRIVGRGESLRIENRFPGADANPYLAYAAFIAAGLEGIEQRLPLPEAWGGNGYEAEGTPRLPASLREAADVFEGSRFARRAFGDTVWAHYLNAARVEQAAFDQVVTHWEKARYFERA